jgi:3-oxoacyl-[acyl-carrier-protein] synthase-1
MRAVFVVAENIWSPLGTTTEENFEALKKDRSGIRLHEDPRLSPTPFYASLFPEGTQGAPSKKGHTKFEQLLIASITTALSQTQIDLQDHKTALVISSTKGNISAIEDQAYSKELKDQVALHHSARLIADHFRSPNQPIVVSNACISGLVALLTAYRSIQTGRYDHAVVSGCDVITQFILSGFQSFMAVSPVPCRPFDADRSGITLGEGAATVVLSADRKYASPIRIGGGAVSNDANHISGPSRTGEELAQAISRALQQAGLSARDIDMISAHGTATAYNDEMEAKAIDLTEMTAVPVNSLKGNYGHTLGAASLIESVITIRSLSENLLLPTKNFSRLGVSRPINICRTLQAAELTHALKTASGFGGCNAALVFSKD